MCYWKKKYEDKELTAINNITVYKVVRTYTLTKDSFRSKYKGFRYNFGQTEKTKLENKTGFNIEWGFHSYKTVFYGTNFTQGMNTVKAVKRSSFGVTNIGYYDSVIIECIIPKGSKYFFNGTDYVSNSIKPICIILPEDKTYNKMPVSFIENINTNFNITIYE